MVGAIVCKAATRYVRKSVGSLSPLSSDSQATCRSQPATHALTSVVFPKPAGAAMRVSLRCRPSFSRSIRRGRLTTFGRSRGIYSFVVSMGGGMPAYVPGLCGLPFSSLLSSERPRTATSSGVMLSKAPTFEGYILSHLYGVYFQHSG